MKSVSVIGLGYIGLPTSILLAQRGYKVQGFDIDEDRVAKIKTGEAIFREKQLQERLREVLSSRQFESFGFLKQADIYIITVPTPLTSSKAPDHSHVFQAISEVTKLLKNNDLLIVESTCAVGLTREIFKKIQFDRPDLFDGEVAHFYLAYCPERVLPGNIFFELENNSRVIGGINPESSKKIGDFYRTFVRGQIDQVDSSTAEMIKLIENTYRDVNIAFANEVSEIAVRHNVNPFLAIEIANKHPRVNILNPGPGVGGHCIAIDPWFLIYGAENLAKLSHIARVQNEMRPAEVARKIIEIVGTCKISPKLLLLGMTYKANSDDTRESPSAKIIRILLHRKLDIDMCDPYLSDIQINDVNLVALEEITTRISDYSHVVILVNHDLFHDIEPLIREHKAVLDFCGYLDPK
jgi:UDP-N-acetyl-D-mannosaminuronic acid dehydrogenase